MMGQTCGGWISSHVLHIYLVHAPDFLGCSDIIGMALDRAQDVERGLSLKKAGNQLMEFVGRRAIHINMWLGGFYSVPTWLEFRTIAEELLRALDNALVTVEWVSRFEFPDFELDHELLALTAQRGDRSAPRRSPSALTRQRRWDALPRGKSLRTFLSPLCW
jgi:coenzyme F420-reducing hydrogenase alpha subunit